MEEKVNGLLTVKDVSELLQVQERTVIRWVKNKEGFPAPIMLTPKTMRWRPEDLNKWIDGMGASNE